MTRDEIDRSSRGILDPGRMRRHARLVRGEAEGALRGIVADFWAVSWEVPVGTEFVQPILSHPASNLSVGPASSRGLDDDRVEATLVGVVSRIDRRRLRGTGVNVAAKFAPGMLGALTGRPAADLTDRIVPADALPGLDARALAAEVGEAVDGGNVAAGFTVIGRCLETVVAAADPDRLAQARDVAGWCALVERERSLVAVGDLAREAGVGVRTLQRLFREHVGASPRWVVRRQRLLDAADAARDGRPPSWAALAADLGYADQAHLSRDFRDVVGSTPSAYARSVVPVSS